ncbi:MAG: MgtC/SapB family protein [Bacilli bacterium]
MILTYSWDVKTIDSQIIDYFNSLFNGNGWGNFMLIALCLICSVIFGGILGYQRESHGHAAGFRTQILISLGSCVIMILSIYGAGSLENVRDPMRLAAAGVTGIGFLGAGAIVQNGINVKGLTTAATIWICMAIGMACGAGYIILSFLVTIMSLICLSVFSKIEELAKKHNANILLVVDSENNTVPILLSLIEKYELVMRDLNTTLSHFGDKKVLRITFKVSNKTKKQINDFVEDLKNKTDPIEIHVL